MPRATTARKLNRKPIQKPIKPAPDRLYHFTCAHGFVDISKTGVLLPNVHPLMRHMGPLLWLTDLAAPSPESVGLTSEWITCDRLVYRYIVQTRAAIHWWVIRNRISPAVVEAMEAFGEPSHWWVARRPLLASEFALDESYEKGKAIS